MEFKKAVKNESKLRVAISGASGSGKTYSSLQIATGIGGKIAVIDTERGSASLYADVFNFDVLNVEPPYTPEKYVEALYVAESKGYSVVIIDSMTHAWAGTGGLLDMHDAIQKTNKGGNSFTAWKEITPIQNRFVDAVVGSRCHIIATMRSKQDYIIDQSNNRTHIRKVGLAPIQREGIEYEFTIYIEVSQEHVAIATKDRTNIFDGKCFVPSEETGKLLVKWLTQAPEIDSKQSEINITKFTNSNHIDANNSGSDKANIRQNIYNSKILTINDIAKVIMPELKQAFSRNGLTSKQIMDLWEKHAGNQREIMDKLIIKEAA